jgi:hypothetical protein
VPVTVYKSSDAGAPVLNNASSSLVAVLDACLVNGFGAKPGAGWTKPYSFSTTGASYKQGAGSNGFYLNVEDTQPNFGRARGFETMTAYNTGPTSFPTDGQQLGATYFQKTNNTTANQPWVLIATSRTFYFFSAYDATAAHVLGTAFYFGDFISEKPGDTFNTMIMGSMGASQTTDASNAPSTSYIPYYSWTNLVMGGHYAARSHTGIGGGVQIGRHANFARLGQNANASWLSSYGLSGGGGTQGLIYPSPLNGSMYVSPVWIHEADVVRGRMPGMYLFATRSVRPVQLDTYTGSGDMAGKTFVCINLWNAQLHIETSDTWYS